ncbi:Uncharacterised protein [uncultured archaeon]|nr:Uncharacterised protein [uncultured archaeon]
MSGVGGGTMGNVICWDVNGLASFSHPTNATIQFTYAGNQKLYSETNDPFIFFNFTVNKASGILSYFAFAGPYSGKGFAASCTTLNLTAGEFDTWDGTGSYGLTVTNTATIAGTLNGKASSVTVGAVIISGTYVATSATTLINSKDASTGYSFRNNGVFTHNNGTVTVNYNGNTKFGGSTTPTTFYNYNITGLSAARTYTYDASRTITIAHDIDWRGNGTGKELKLRSSTPGTQWSLNLGAGSTQDLYYLDVQDSVALGNTAIALGSIDSGNNINWIFAPGPHPGAGFQKSVFRRTLFDGSVMYD